jgi:hypothetical protein
MAYISLTSAYRRMKIHKCGIKKSLQIEMRVIIIIIIIIHSLWQNLFSKSVVFRETCKS